MLPLAGVVGMRPLHMAGPLRPNRGVGASVGIQASWATSRAL